MSRNSLARNPVTEGLKQLEGLRAFVKSRQFKACKAEALASLRELERKLGVESQNYNSSGF